MGDTKETQAVVIHQHQEGPVAPFFPSREDWKLFIDWGESALKSGLLPDAIRTKEAAAITVLKGRELGIPFMVAIAHIHIIKGKPSMSAELMQAQARKNLPGLKINVVKLDKLEAIIKFKRPEPESEWFTSSFTMDDAKQAELLGNPSWKKYPKAMLFSRAISAGLRIVCPEALMGVSYTPEELGANVDEGGNVIETTGRNLDTGAHIPAPKQPKDVQAESAPPSGPTPNQNGPKPNPGPNGNGLNATVLMNRIRALREELKVGDDEWGQFLHRMNIGKAMTPTQMQGLVAALEDEKKQRQEAITVPPQNTPPTPEEEQPWMQDIGGHLSGEMGRL